MTSIPLSDQDAFERFRITSRREILSLLRALTERNQLISVSANGGSESVVTSILHVDDVSGIVVVDCAPGATANQRILDSRQLSFETTLDSIRILFSVNEVGECLFENRPALQIPIPTAMVRLQRRETYRIATPVVSPVRCTIPMLDPGGKAVGVTLPLKDISGGGLALIDEKFQIDNTIGKVYTNCKLDLPGSPVVVSLEIRNSADSNLRTGRQVRKLGCQFIDPSNAAMTAIQRYITKLERERNARATGML